MIAWTDYPFVELGDLPNEEAPVRQCQVVSWDGNKYANVTIDGHSLIVKLAYLYTKKGRLGEVRGISPHGLEITHGD